MEEIIVSVSIVNHDRSITVLKNGEVKTILIEDRVSRTKNDYIYPYLSILELPKIVNKIDYLILFGSSHEEEEKNILDYFNKIKLVPKNLKIIRGIKKNHHQAHASSSFYGSGFKKAVCLSIDGFGGLISLPQTNNNLGKFTTSIFSASYPNNFKLKYANIWYETKHFNVFPEYCNNDKIYDYNSNLDIGNIYEAVARYLGFYHANDVGKVMGLSSYGKEDLNIPPLLYKDTLYANANLFRGDKEIQTNLNPYLKNLTKEKAMNLAFAVQKTFNKVLYKRVKQSLELTQTNNLVFSGGCALNVLGNYLIKKKFPNINLYIDPIANDSCLSYGVAKSLYYTLNPDKEPKPLKSLYHGPKYSNKEIMNTVINYI